MEEYQYDPIKLERAKKKVKKIKGFYIHLTCYIVVIPILAFINYRTTSFLWVMFPTLGWGFGLMMHGFEVFGYNPLISKEWEERQIRKYMEEDKRESEKYR